MVSRAFHPALLRIFLRSALGRLRERRDFRGDYRFSPAAARPFCQAISSHWLTWGEMEARDTSRRQLLGRAKVYDVRETYWEIAQ